MSLRALLDVPAPAKLNLFLHVVGRRADGYHLIESVFVLIDWCDLLHFERRADGALTRHDLGPALPADDLCLRAARRLQRESGCPLGADITLDKRVPWGAGLGGGSSDAASTLLALNRLWGLRWPRERLLALALQLGADVPFFVGGTNAFVEGIGERLTPLPTAVPDAPPRRWYAVVKPPQAIATRDIFEHPALVRNSPTAILSGSFVDALHSENGLPDWAREQGRNDLQPPAQSLVPEVAQAARWLEDRYGNSRMTGSGSAVSAQAGASDLPVATFPVADLPPGWVGRMCRGLDRHPLVDWAD